MPLRLTKMKVSGFKSFVDPTTILVPGNLIAVVGPNGCGKSNIIDAATWVMGESSPKYLRGESLTDVIFNGSSARKPVGQASVELIFDNSDGSIGGEYANYSEISIKRVINRDSDSSYFLNGSRCRKRDITDIFLGTGLGPRSYSIIGQNMISRVIEAKPEELRTYLEEAAGISKYKERRHETELRIGHTKDNLARIIDVRTELEKQLSHLKHQANVAEKFKILKQQERTLRGELYAMQWRQLDSLMVDHTLKIQREETALEARNSELTGTDREIEQLRHEQRVANDAFQEVQRRYYSVGNEITRVEQDILHQEERQKQWETDLSQTENDWQAMKDQVAETEEELKDITRDIDQFEPQLEIVAKEAETYQRKLTVAEEVMNNWQQRFDEFNQVSSKNTQTVQVEKNRIQHIQQKIDFMQKRLEQLQQDQGRINFADLDKEIEDYSKQSYETAEKLEGNKKDLENVKQSITAMQAALRESNTRLDTVRSELQRSRGEQASLQALQQTALGQRDNPTAPWAAKYQLDKKPRLAQHIEVESGWESAVENALGYNLQAICVEKMEDVVPHLSDFKSGNLSVFATDQASDTQTTKSNKGVLLLDKVKSPWPLESLLHGVYAATTLEEALKLSDSLAEHESVMTQEGVWLGKRSLKVLREEDAAAGVFQREQQLKAIAAKITQAEETRQELEKNIQQRQEQLKKLEEERETLQQTCNQQQAQAAQINAQQKMKQERLTELKAQAERLLREQDDCTRQVRQAEAELADATQLWEKASEQTEAYQKQREEMTQERDHARQQLHEIREHAREKSQHKQELEIKVQTAKSQKGSYTQSISRLHVQLASLSERKLTLQSELSSMPPMDTLKQALTRALDKHVGIEGELNTARVAMEALDQEYRNLEEKRLVIERDINKVRSALETLRVDMQGWKVKSDSIMEQIKETELQLEDILKELPEEGNPNEWQAKLDQTLQRISRLGAINLVAIDEYATCLERKQYLDAQLEDLQAGLATLEEAIGKIDKETRIKFKETFDQVNARFQELFPTIFGGGRAYLELNSDNLLEAGVTMMACPPGKRNSSIYLLSGGEKSLTALALVFSIFHLNPSPFCMLDEVDAALDDVNVSRFTRLVKAMAEKTQFIFISHNKITIEMGEYLIGVTMNEPGVSRLVSVDIAKAIDLAGA